MIIVFDSGIGGFDLTNKLTKFNNKKKKELEIFYYADKENFPYGNKTKEELFKAISNIFEKLANKNPSCIIIACNTASIIIEEFFPNKTYKGIPIFHTLDALKFFASKEIKLSILSTILTSEYLLQDATFNKHEIIGLKNLAQAIENSDQTEINNELYKLKLTNKTLYACTHFPLIEEQFKKHFAVEFINPIDKMISQIAEKFELEAKIKLNFAQKSIEEKYYALY